jgi:hypothetical protein
MVTPNTASMCGIRNCRGSLGALMSNFTPKPVAGVTAIDTSSRFGIVMSR